MDFIFSALLLFPYGNPSCVMALASIRSVAQLLLVLVAHCQLDDYGFDEDDIGPHGSAPGGPGYNVQVGDSLKELNQKTLEQRATYRPAVVSDQCIIEVCSCQNFIS